MGVIIRTNNSTHKLQTRSDQRPLSALIKVLQLHVCAGYLRIIDQHSEEELSQTNFDAN